MKTAKLHQMLFGTLRGQLILSVALVHAVLMSLFVVDLVRREHAFLVNRQVEEATALSQSLATSAADWIVADDVVGMQELVEGQRRYPELLFAILADEQGRVLAHTDHSLRGLYLHDLPQEEQTVTTRTPALVDVMVPAFLAGRHVGWARVGIGQQVAGRKLARITRSGISYAITAIVIGSFFAWFMGRRITRRLYAVQSTMDAVRAGDRQARCLVIGIDEAGAMAREFNTMLDSLAESDAKLLTASAYNRILIEANLDALMTIGPDGKITDVNAATESLTGCARGDLIGKDFSGYFTDTEKARIGYQEVFREGSVRDYPLELRHCGGHVTSVLYNASVYRDQKGEIEGVIAAARDVTERKRAEEALRRAAEEIRDLYNHAPCGYHSLDKDGAFLRINETELEWLGYRHDEVLGEMKFSDILTADSLKNFEENFPRFKATGSVRELEFELIRKDGSIMPVLLSATAINDSDGNYVMGRSTVFDITDRKRAEQERLAHLHFFESMDRVNRAIQGTNDLEQMMSDVLDVVLSTLECDRAWLVYPCDLDAASWRVPMERTRPEYPGASIAGLEIPMDPEIQRVFRTVLSSNGPVPFGPEFEHFLPEGIKAQFGVQSQVAMAIYPKADRPYVVGVHQCSHPRIWTVEEKRLFQEIGRRLTDGLNSLLAYQDLRESEEKYRAVADFTYDWEYWLGPDGGYVYVSPACERTTGYRVEEFLNEPALLERIVHPDDRALFSGHLGQSMSRNGDDAINFRIITRGGEVRWIGHRCRSIHGREGQYLGRRGANSDITERKRAEEKMAQLAAIVQSSDDAIIGKTLEGSILSWNRGAEMIYGYADSEVIGGPISMLIPPECADELPLIIEKIKSGEHLNHYETVRRRKDGESIHVSLTISPIEDAEGKIVAVSTIGHDITERKRAEDELKHSIAEKDLLLKEIHHRVKNNLQVIIGLIQMQARASSDAEMVQTLKELQERVRVMALVHDQLYRSHSFYEIDFGRYLKELTDNLLQVFGAEGIVLEVNAESVFLEIETVITCGLITTEIVTNALKYAFPTPQSELSRRIRVEFTESESGYTLVVSDNGVGIPEGFDVSGATTMGLHLVNLWSTYQLNGSIETRTDDGTTFIIRFPKRGKKRSLGQ